MTLYGAKMITTEQAVARQAEHECLLSEAVALLQRMMHIYGDQFDRTTVYDAQQIINKAKGR
jgi:hypothetical protein